MTRSSLLLLVLTLAVVGCRKKRAPPPAAPTAVNVDGSNATGQVPSAQQQNNGSAPNTATARRPEPSVQVDATYFGNALPKTVGCTIEVRNVGSLGRPVADGKCGEVVLVASGDYDITTIVTWGDSHRVETKSTQKVGGNTLRVAQSLPFGFGRLKIAKKGDGKCTLSANHNGKKVVPAFEADWVMLPANRYELRALCDVPGPDTEESIGFAEVVEGRDVSLGVDVTAGKPALTQAPGPSMLVPGVPAPTAAPREAAPFKPQGVEVPPTAGTDLAAPRSPDTPITGSETRPTPGTDLQLQGAEVAKPKYAD